MINITHLLKITSAWVSIVYVVCFAGVAMFPSIRPGFMMYGLHTRFIIGENIATFGTFLAGLVIWNVIGLLAVWLFAWLFNTIKQ